MGKRYVWPDANLGPEQNWLELTSTIAPNAISPNDIFDVTFLESLDKITPGEITIFLKENQDKLEVIRCYVLTQLEIYLDIAKEASGRNAQDIAINYEIYISKLRELLNLIDIYAIELKLKINSKTFAKPSVYFQGDAFYEAALVRAKEVKERLYKMQEAIGYDDYEEG